MVEVIGKKINRFRVLMGNENCIGKGSYGNV